MLKTLLTLSLIVTGCSVTIPLGNLISNNEVTPTAVPVTVEPIITHTVPVSSPTTTYDISSVEEALATITTSREVNETAKGDDFVLVPKISNEIVDIISYAEVADKDTLYGDNIRKGRYMPKGHQPLSKTPINELTKLQKDMLKKGSVNTPIGLCQFNMATLIYLKDTPILKDRELFDEATQRGLCVMYIEKHVKISDWLNNKITTDQFINRLANKWAPIPTTNGVSKYHQRVGIPLSTLRRKLKYLKRNYSDTYVRIFS